MSRFSCAVTPSTRDAIGRRMITILKDPEFKNLDFKGLCNKMWSENFSKYVKNDKSVFALDCLSQIPMIINDNIRTQGDTDDETYKLLKSRFSEEDIKLIQKLDADLRTNDWFEVAKQLAGDITTSLKDQQVIDRLIQSENFIPKITKIKTQPIIGSYIVYNDNLYRVEGIDGEMVDARQVDALNQPINDVHLIRNINEFFQPYEHPQGTSMEATFRSGQYRFGDILTFEPKMSKPDENGISELFFNAKRDGKDVKISFRSQEFPELYKISTDFGNITNPDDFKPVYVKVVKSSADLNIVNLEIIEPFILGDVSDVELVNRPIIEQQKKTFEDEVFSTMTSNLYRLSSLAINPTTNWIFDNEHTSTPNNERFQDRFVSEVSILGTQASFNGTDIRLVAEMEGNLVVLKVCDLDGNVLKFKLNENKSIIEAEDGKPVKFMLDDLLGLKDTYNELLKNRNKKTNRSFEQEFQSNFYKENSYNEFLKRLENAKDNHATIESKIKNGEKVFFDIVGVSSNERQAYNYASSKGDLKGKEFVFDTKSPKLRLKGTDFDLHMPVMSDEHINYFVSLLTEELFSSPNIRLNNQQRYNILKAFFHEGIDFGNNLKLRFDLGTDNELRFFLQKKGENGIPVAKFNNNSEFIDIDGFSKVIDKFKELYKKEYTFNGINNGFSLFEFALDKNLINNDKLYKPSITDGIVDTELYDYRDVLEDDFKYRYIEYNRNYEVPTGVLELKYHTEPKEEQVQQEQTENKNITKVDVSELFTSIEAKAHITKASEEDIYAAKKWFESNPISQHLKFQQAFDIAHKQAVAEWNKYGLILYKGSDYADLYHEAWHEFTQYYLSQEEKDQLYDALGKRSGKFIDNKGKEVSYDKANDEQKEEKLAEMFRDYMLDKNKPRGIFAKIFKKIKDFLNFIFKDKNEKLIERTFDTLCKGDLSAYRKSENNVRFTKLYRAIKCTDEVTLMTESDSLKIRNITDNLMVNFLTFKSMYPHANFDDILGYMETRFEEGRDAAEKKYREGKINKDIDNFLAFYSNKFIVDNAANDPERFDEKVVKKAQDYLDSLPKYISIDINAALTKNENVKNAFKYIKASLIQMHVATELLDKNDPKLNILKNAIDNFGNIDLLGQTKKKESVGVVGFIMTNSNYFKEVEEEELDLDDTETAIKEEHDPDPNSKSTIQRLDPALNFLLSTIPAYKLDYDGKYVPDVDDFGMQKSKNVTSIVNMLNFLHGSVSVQDMYDRLEFNAYYHKEKDGKITINRNKVINPMIKSILDRLGPYDFKNLLEKTDDFNNPELSRYQLINKFWNVFATSEPINYQANIDVEKKHAEDNYLQQKITDVSISAGEFSGAFWRFKNLYETKFADVTNTNPYVSYSPNGNYLNIDKIIGYYGGTPKVFIKGDFNKENILQRKIEFINATGIPLTYSKAIEQAMDTNEWDEKILKIYERVSQYVGKRVYNPIEDIYLKYDKYSLRDVLKDIIALDMTVCEDVNIEMIQNAEGNVVFKNQLNNTLLIMVNHINAAQTYQDMLKDPAMKHLDVRRKIQENGEWVDNPHYNPDTTRSEILGSIFDLTLNPDGTYNPNTFGAKKADTKISIVNFSGLKINEYGDFNSSSGVKLFNADKDTKILADISLLLNGQQEFMRFADKGTSYGFTLINNNKKGWLPVSINNVFGSGKVDVVLDEQNEVVDINEGSACSDVIKKYINYLRSELERQDNVRNNTEMSIEEYDHDYLNRAYNFGFFDDILSDETKKKIMSNFGLDDNFADFSKEKQKEILSLAVDDIAHYIFVKVKEQRDLIENTTSKFPGVIDSFKKVMSENINDENASKKVSNISTEDFLTGLAFLFFTNNQIYNFESIKLFFGDIMTYNHLKEEFTKRIGGFGSTGQIFNDDEITRTILKNAHESSYAKTVLGIDKNPLYEEEHEGELKTAICADTNPLTPYLDAIKQIIPEEFAKAYDRIEEESNAQGLISFDAYRELSMRESMWSPEMERLYQMINAREAYERLEDKSKWQGAVPKEISWTDTLKFFPVRKFQYIGPLATNSKYLTAFHKYSLMPLIPNMLRVQVNGVSVGRNMMYVHDQMVKEGIHYITFNSGSKLGNISRKKNISEENKKKIKGSGDLIYDIDRLDYKSRLDENGNIISRELIPFDGQVFTPNYIPIAYLKDQQAIHDELEDRVILSTQLKRLIENNLFDSGVPYDFIEAKGKLDENNKPIKSEKQAREVWKRNYDKYLFDENEKEKAKAEKYLKENSKYFTLALKFERSIAKLTEFAIESIKKEFDIQGEKASEKLINFIRKELEKKGIPQFAIDGVTDIRELQFSFVADQIENILMSTINSRVIRQKVHGGQFIQVSGSLWETPNTIVGTTENPVANELEFYKNAIKTDDTVKPAHCKIPLAGDYVHMLRLKHFDGHSIKTLERLNECLKNVQWCEEHKEYIRFIAVRIPVQGHNSMEYLQIQEFLAPGCNNIIVCPTEIVIKSGGDYDIDKLSCILPNISSINGEPMIVHSSEKKVDKKQLNKAKNEMIEADKEYSKSIRDALSELMNGKHIEQNIQQEARKLNDDRLELTQRINNYLTVLQDADLSKDLSDDEYLQMDRVVTELKAQRNIVWDKIHDLIKQDAKLSAKITEKKQKYEKANSAYAELKKGFLTSSRIAYENDLLSTMCEIIELKANNATLLTPNSNIIYASEGKPANVLEMNADYDKMQRVFDSDKEHKMMSPTRCTEYIYNLNKHDDFNVGKTVLGPAAIDNVFSSLLRRVGAYMNHESASTINFNSLPQNSYTVENYKGKNYDLKTDYMKIAYALKGDIELINDTLKKNTALNDNRYVGLSKRELKKYKSALQSELERICAYCVQDMILPHNTTIVNGKECIDISGNFAAKTDDTEQYTINEEISEYITGCVDVAKGAWIKYIQANMVAIPIYMYMIQAGVPSDYACYFIANPLIRKYLDARLAQRSNADLLTEKNYAESNNNILRAKILGLETHDAVTTTIELYEEMNKIEYGELYEPGQTETASKYLVSVDTLKKRALSKDGIVKNFDKRLLVELFRIEDQCEIINSVKLSVRVDQTKNNNVFNVLQKQRNIDKLNNDQRIDPKFIEAIKKDTVISSFFQEEFINDIVSQVLPYKLDKDILTAAEETLDPITLKSLPSSNIETETIRFQSEFINFLWQKDLKTAPKGVLAFGEHPEIYELCRKVLGEDVFPTSNPDVLQNFYNNLDYVFDKFQNYDKVEDIRKSNFYQKITLGRFDAKTENQAEIKESNRLKDAFFYAYIAALLSGNTTVLFRYGNLSYPVMFKTALTALQGFNEQSFGGLLFNDSFNVVRNKIVKKEFKKYKDKNTDEEKTKLANETNYVSSNLYFTFGTNNDTIGVLKEEYANISNGIWIKDNLRTKSEKESFAGFSRLTDVDLDFMDIVFNFLPKFGILQSGIHSSYSNSINALFPVNSQFNRLYDEFTQKSDDEKKALLLDFSNSFLNKFSANNALRLKDFSYDNFHEADESIVMDEFEKQPESRKTEDGIYCLHSGGAEGSDQIFGHCAASYGIKVNHYTAENKSSKKSNVTGKDISLVKITQDEYNYGYAKYKVAANKLGRDIYQKNTPQGGLLARDFIQAYNADQIFAIGTIERNNVKGGTGYAVQMAIDMHKDEIYVYDQVQKSWYKIRYNENGTHSWDKLNFIPKITSYNFAGIGTREINDDGKNAIANLFRNSFEEDSTTYLTYNGENIARNTVLTHPNSLILFADNLDRTEVLNTGQGDKLKDKKVVSTVHEANGKYAERFKDTKTFMGYGKDGLRGLDNAFPITVKKRYKYLVNKDNNESDKWNDSDAEEFEKVIDNDINVIKDEIVSKSYRYVYFPENFFLHLTSKPNLGKDADISKERTPKLYDILNNKLTELAEFIRQYNIELNKEGNDIVTFDTVEEYNKSPYPKSQRTILLSPTKNSSKHFGNPFSDVNVIYRAGDEQLHQTKRVPDKSTAVKNYKEWLWGKLPIEYEKERRNWILQQIKKGNLDNSILVTLKSDGDIAEVIKELIDKSKNTFISNLDKKQREDFQKHYDKEMLQENYVKDTMRDVKNGIAGDFVKHFFNNEEINILNETLKNNNGRLNINSASRHTDPVFHKETVLKTLEDNDKKKFGAPDRIYAMEIWSKHDGLPMEEILQACKDHRVAPIVSFSISGLGNKLIDINPEQKGILEPGVLNYEDLLHSIKHLIDKKLLDPNFTTIRIDPFVPGVTDLRDIDSIVEIASEMGIKRFTTSVMQTYGLYEGDKTIMDSGLPIDRKIIQRFEELGLTKQNYFNIYYGENQKKDDNGNVIKRYINHLAKQEYSDAYAAHLIQIMDTYDVTIMSCQHNLSGLKHAPCLDPAVVEKLVGTNEFNKETGRGCVGGCLQQTDILNYADKCYSGCTYCYASQDNLPLRYYDWKGNLITDNPEEALEIAQVIDNYYEEDRLLIDQNYSIDINDAEPIINVIKSINDFIDGQGSLFNIDVNSIENENIRNFLNKHTEYVIQTEKGNVIPMSLLDSFNSLDTFKVNGNESIFNMKVRNPLNYLVQQIDNANKTLHLYDEDIEIVDENQLDDLINTCKLS